MIGRFKTEEEAKEAEGLIDAFKAVVEDASEHREINVGESNERFPERILEFARSNDGIFLIRPEELEQVLYDVSIERKENQINITTDEFDVSALMKILIDMGARIEIYSAHKYPKTGIGRDTSGS